MKWADVNWLYHGFTATLMYTTKERPTTVERRYGRIICNGPDSVTYLEHIHGGRYVKPYPNTEVVIHEPPADAKEWR